MKYLIIILLQLFACQLYAEEFPIVAYYGIPHKYATLSRYNDMREAGFNISIDHYTNAKDAIKCLSMAENAGIKLIMSGNCMKGESVENFVAQVCTKKALYGYCLADEPRMSDYNELSALKKRIIGIDKNAHPCYLNLFPNYDDVLLKHIGVEDYEQYLLKYSKLKTPQLSFDFYPFTKRGERKRWMQTLMAVKKVSTNVGRPFWGFILITPHSVYPQQSYSQLLLQAYTNLAFGAQGLEYFTYWTPPKYGPNDFHDAPIDIDGNKTDNYRLVKKLNKQIYPYLRFFKDAEVERIGCLGKIPEGMEKMEVLPYGIKNLKMYDASSALLSVMSKRGNRYLVIVNRDVNNKMRLKLTYSNDNVKCIAKDGSSVKVKSEYIVEPGDMLMLNIVL